MEMSRRGQLRDKDKKLFLYMINISIKRIYAVDN